MSFCCQQLLRIIILPVSFILGSLLVTLICCCFSCCVSALVSSLPPLDLCIASLAGILILSKGLAADWAHRWRHLLLQIHHYSDLLWVLSNTCYPLVKAVASFLPSSFCCFQIGPLVNGLPFIFERALLSLWSRSGLFTFKRSRMTPLMLIPWQRVITLPLLSKRVASCWLIDIYCFLVCHLHLVLTRNVQHIFYNFSHFSNSYEWL